MSFLISDALAQTATTTAPAATHAAGGNNFASLLMLVGFVVIFYLLLWRPQAKRQKEHRELVNNLAKGDEVVTSGGILGRIVDVTDDFIVLAIADNVTIKLQKGSVANILPKGTVK